MPEELTEEVGDEEFLYRGIVENNWDFKNNRPSSATFKDSKGVSVDRDATRDEKECVEFLSSKKAFYAICKIKTKDVKSLSAIVKYLPLEGNPFHSEIHDSAERVQMRGSKPKKLRDSSIVIKKP